MCRQRLKVEGKRKEDVLIATDRWHLVRTLVLRLRYITSITINIIKILICITITMVNIDCLLQYPFYTSHTINTKKLVLGRAGILWCANQLVHLT